RHAIFDRLRHFHIGLVYRRRSDHHIGVTHILGTVTDLDTHAHITQTRHHRRFAQIGTADIITLVGQHFGNTTHAGTTDANKMNATNAAQFRYHLDSISDRGTREVGVYGYDAR